MYNEQFYDLLNENYGNNPSGKLTDLAVRDDAKGNLVVKGLRQVVTDSEEDALNLLFQGETARSIAEHAMNKNSTRSHCIFTIFLETRSRVESSEKIVLSKLNLVDLAGSERVGKTGSRGTTLSEAKYINKSLSFLEQVVVALTNRSRDHIPFRQSKLTNVLRDSLGGNCKTRMIANIHCEKPHMEETISTLKFATRMMRVSNEATINVQLDPVMLVKKYEHEIKALKQELAMHDTLANRGAVSYEAFTPEQQTEIKHVVRDYISGDIQSIDVINLRQINEIFKQFKNYALNLENKIKSGGGMDGHGFGSMSLSGPDTGDATDVKTTRGLSISADDDDFVGEMDGATGGFHIGTAPIRAAPRGGVAMMPSPNKHMFTNDTTSSADVASRSTIAFDGPKPSEAEAFKDFKTNDGAEHSATLQQNKDELRSKKVTLKQLTVTVNTCKRSIDELNQMIRERRENRDINSMANMGDVQVIDEDEYILIRKCKQKKQEYQTAFHERKMLLNEINYLKGLVEQSKVNLANKFIEWYSNTYGSSAMATKMGIAPVVGERVRTAGSTDSGSVMYSGDVLDDGEQFDKLELQKIMDKDPESVSYYRARKAMKQTMKANGTRRSRDKNAGSRRWA